MRNTKPVGSPGDSEEKLDQGLATRGGGIRMRIGAHATFHGIGRCRDFREDAFRPSWALRQGGCKCGTLVGGWRRVGVAHMFLFLRGYWADKMMVLILDCRDKTPTPAPIWRLCGSIIELWCELANIVSSLRVNLSPGFRVVVPYHLAGRSDDSCIRQGPKEPASLVSDYLGGTVINHLSFHPHHRPAEMY